MSAVEDVEVGATVARRAASTQPRERETALVSVLHIRNSTIISANMIASPATHMTAPPAWRSPTAVPAQPGLGPGGSPGVPRLPYVSTRPVNVSTGITRKSRTSLVG